MRYIVLILLFVTGLFWFCVALIDLFINNASQYSDLGLAGKISVWMFMVCLGFSVVIALMMPFASFIYKKAKTWF